MDASLAPGRPGRTAAARHRREGNPLRYRGPLLWDLLADAGPTVDAAINEDILRRVVFATSTDGNRAVLAPGEIDPRFMAGKAIVATSADGEPLPPGARFRLIVPYDKLVGRALKSLRSIEVRRA